MDKATLRPYVFEILRKTPQTHFHAIENDVRKLVETYERHDVLILQEILWELLVQGVLAPGKNSLNLNLPFVHLTEYGSQCLEDGRIAVHDPDSYIARLTAVTDNAASDLVVNTVREALTAFLAGSWFSCVVLLARTAEHLFDELAAQLSKALRDSPEALSDLTSARRFSRDQAQIVIQAVQQHVLPSELSEVVDPQLGGLLALIQHSRTPDGAPRCTLPSRDQVLGFFLLYPEQCAFVYHLMATLEEDASPRP